MTRQRNLRRKKIFCSDGHIVDSLGEQDIDEFLTQCGIEHLVHHKLAGTKCSIDFWLPEYKAGIEFLGAIGFKPYDERQVKKKETYVYYNIPVVYVEPGDKLDASLFKKIREAIIQARGQRAKDWAVLRG